MDIAIFVGSLRKKSFNKMLAERLEEVKPKGMSFTYISLGLPLYNGDQENIYPAIVQKQKDLVRAADGVLFVTPEYNRSLPGVLKNAMDWISRPYGTSAFDGKAAGVVGAGLDHVSGAIAQADLRHIAAYLNMKVMPQPEIHIALASEEFDENGTLSERWMENLKEYMNSFAAWVERENSPSF